MERGLALVRAYIRLTKPTIVLLVLWTTLTTMLMVPASVPTASLVLWAVLGTALAAGSANALNMYVDRDIDAVMSRTRRRPLPSGLVKPQNALLFGIALGVVSFVLLAVTVNLLSALVALGGILFYVVVYTMWLKRSTPYNIVIGGAAGAVGPLIGWAAVEGRLDIPAWLLFAIVFLWTPPHFWALALWAKEDYARAAVPMLPVVRGERETKRQILWYTVLLVLSTLLLYWPLRVGGPLYLAAAVLLGYLFIARALHIYRAGTPAQCKSLFWFSIVYLFALFGALAADVNLLGRS